MLPTGLHPHTSLEVPLAPGLSHIILVLLMAGSEPSSCFQAGSDNTTFNDTLPDPTGSLFYMCSLCLPSGSSLGWKPGLRF